MKARANLNFPKEEKDALNKLEVLFHDWTDHMRAHLRAFQDYSVEDFVFDGFYPHYFN